MARKNLHPEVSEAIQRAIESLDEAMATAPHDSPLWGAIYRKRDEVSKLGGEDAKRPRASRWRGSRPKWDRVL